MPRNDPEYMKKYMKRYYATPKGNAIIKKLMKKYILKNKILIVNHYSNGKNCCNCCGESQLEFLSLDHLVQGNGRKEREEAGGGNALYRKLIKAGYPEGFQILCFNCNLSKGFYGKCPHTNTLK